jgi:hypothetical protein
MVENIMFKELMKYVLPEEIVSFFSLVDIKEEPYKDTSILHLYLDENNVLPSEYQDIELSPNGFYPESTIKDFPLRDKKVVLHVRGRRWKDDSGKSYSRQWNLTAEGTRYSHDFASFLKETFGYQPDTDAIA